MEYLCPMQKLVIRNIECYAFHDCLEEETKIGSHFSVSLAFEGDFSEAMEHDDITKAVDYVVVHDIVRKQMAVPSRLIEQVASRIWKELKKTFPAVVICSVTISKFNPPVNGQLGEAAFTVSG